MSTLQRLYDSDPESLQRAQRLADAAHERVFVAVMDMKRPFAATIAQVLIECRADWAVSTPAVAQPAAELFCKLAPSKAGSSRPARRNGGGNDG